MTGNSHVVLKSATSIQNSFIIETDRYTSGGAAVVIIGLVYILQLVLLHMVNNYTVTQLGQAILNIIVL